MVAAEDFAAGAGMTPPGAVSAACWTARTFPRSAGRWACHARKYAGSPAARGGGPFEYRPNPAHRRPNAGLHGCRYGAIRRVSLAQHRGPPYRSQLPVEELRQAYHAEHFVAVLDAPVPTRHRIRIARDGPRALCHTSEENIGRQIARKRLLRARSQGYHRLSSRRRPLLRRIELLLGSRPGLCLVLYSFQYPICDIGTRAMPRTINPAP